MFESKTNLRKELEAVQTHYKSSKLPDAREKLLKEYKEILGKYRKTSDLVDEACEAKNTFLAYKKTLTEKVEELEELTKERYKGFLNFWRYYHDLDKQYNVKVESLENALGIETKNIKTGGSKTEALAKYMGSEMLGNIGLGVCLVAGYVLFKEDMLYMAAFLGSVGLCVKGFFSPQLGNRHKREEGLQFMKEDAEFIDQIIEEVNPSKESFFSEQL